MLYGTCHIAQRVLLDGRCLTSQLGVPHITEHQQQPGFSWLLAMSMNMGASTAKGVLSIRGGAPRTRISTHASVVHAACTLAMSGCRHTHHTRLHDTLCGLYGLAASMHL